MNAYSTTNNKKRLSAKLSTQDLERTLSNLTQLTFEVTDNCNLDCKYCGYGDFYGNYDKRTKKNLDTNIAKNLLNYMVNLWNSNLNCSHNKTIYISFYGGEPLLNFSFIKEIVEYVSQMKLLHNKIKFAMTTNALLLEKYMDFIAEHKFNLLISLDGNRENNSYRVFKNKKQAYDKINKSIKALLIKHPKYFNEYVNFNSVLHNKNSIDMIYQHFKKNFDKKPSISEINTSGIKDSMKKEFYNTYSNVYESLNQSEDYALINKQMFINLPNIQDLTNFIHQYNDNCFNKYDDVTKDICNEHCTPTGTCLPFGKKMFVTVNGKLLPCERIGHNYVLGSAASDKVELDFNAIVERYNNYYDKMMKICKSCYNQLSCSQCVFYLNIEDSHPKCEGFLNKKDFSKYLSSHLGQIEKTPDIYSRILKEVVVEE